MIRRTALLAAPCMAPGAPLASRAAKIETAIAAAAREGNEADPAAVPERTGTTRPARRSFASGGFAVKLGLLPMLVMLAACAPPPPDDVILEPITEQNIYNPAASAAPDPITSEPIASGPIGASPITPVAPASDKERLVAAIEANGCVLNLDNSERILRELGFGEEQLGRIGGELKQEGRVQVVPPAEFRLISGACAS